MGKGTAYPNVSTILKQTYKGGKALEIAAGGAPYKDLFTDYVGTDLPSNGRSSKGDLAVFCDARFLPFGQEKFDFAFVVAALFQIPGTKGLLIGLWQKLKYGGTLVIFDYTLNIRQQALQRHLNQGSHPQFQFWTEEELGQLIKEAGFKNIQKIQPFHPLQTVKRKILGKDKRWLIYKAIKI